MVWYGMVECRIAKQADALLGSDRASEDNERKKISDAGGAKGSSVETCGVNEAGLAAATGRDGKWERTTGTLKHNFPPRDGDGV